MDLDLSLVRAFVVAADEGHFGRAADQLSLTQQAVSKRVKRLEQELGVSLFIRSGNTTSLTDSGDRFLQPARELLASADTAIAAVRESSQQVRVDVLHDRLAPSKLVAYLQRAGDLACEVSARRSLSIALSALKRGEIDAAFGRVIDDDQKWPSDLSYRLARLEPLLALVDVDHPLAALDRVRPEDLREYGTWVPAPGSAVEWGTYLGEFAERFEVSVTFEMVDNVTTDDLLSHARSSGSVFLTGADTRNPRDDALAALPLVEPTPVYPWCLVWRSRDHSPGVRRLLTLTDRLGKTDQERLVKAGEYWLPDSDRALLRPPP